MKNHRRISLLSCLLALGYTPVYGQDPYTQCIMTALEKMGDLEQIAALKDACREEEPTVIEMPPSGKGQPTAGADNSSLERRINQERQNAGNIFAIAPHKPSYLLPGSYNSNPNGLALSMDERQVDRVEIKFQVSFKALLASNFIGQDNGYLYGAYTMKSFWQAYNSNTSSPFRETNHEPELFMAYRTDWPVFWGWKNAYIITGFNHQSNGRDSLSRSWNRLYLDFIFEKDNLALSIKPWYRVPESSKSSSLDASGDDNPDIDSYLGYGEITGAWTLGRQTLSFTLRNNLRSTNNRGAIELGWSFPLWLETPLKGYIQYFNGYGESLVDYNTSVNRLGIGVLMADWL